MGKVSGDAVGDLLEGNDLFKGVRIDIPWDEFQTEPDEFNWNLIDKKMRALGADQYAYIVFLIGPESPKWIYGCKPLKKAIQSTISLVDTSSG
jgi:hypothetical protein